MRWTVIALLATLLAACSRTPGYPHDWPAASPALFGCPDLGGEYDGVDANLPALLAPERNFGKRFYHEHSVLVERDPGDGHYTLTLRRNARGLAAFRDWHLKYNQNSTGDGGFVRIELEKGEDYECSNGWLIGTKWAIMEQPRGDPEHIRLALAKDRSGNLVAGVTTRSESTIMWADAQVASLGKHDHTTWLHWPKRAPGAEEELRAAGSVSLVRYAWRNGGGKLVPTRFANYTADTICVDAPGMEHWEVRPPAHPSTQGPRPAAKPVPPLHCPGSEQKLDQGDVARIPMHVGEYTTVTWHPLGKPLSAGETLEVEAPEDLPSPAFGE
jgi:hypothetical protein